MAKTHRDRAAFTILEITVTLAIIAILSVVVAQCVTWSLRERARLASQQAALELAANVLEASRAQPWAQLDPAWAEAQTVPTEMAALLPQGKVQVTLEPGLPPSTRRVTVEVRWQEGPDAPPQRVELTTVLSRRDQPKTGGQP
jgi:prepilin-type N-terminal cleavage/methylation domain-containing protein